MGTWRTWASALALHCTPDHGNTAEGIIKAADKVMYDVKEGGKNNFAIAAGPSPEHGKP
jgi:GGDEF domain-containing protein